MVCTDLFICWEPDIGEPTGDLTIDTDLRDPVKNHREDITVSSTTVGTDKFVYVTYNIDGGSFTSTRVNDGSGGYVKTANVESIEVSTHGKDDLLDLSGVTISNGYVAQKLNGKVKIKSGKGDDGTAAAPVRGSEFGDRIEGRKGDDFLAGGKGDDVYEFDDHSAESFGNDTIVENAGEGTDSLDYSEANIKVAVDLNVTSQQSVNSGSGHTLTLQNSEIENIYAAHGSFADTLLGNASDNVLQGRGGNDTIDGRAGDDRIEGGSGDDKDAATGDTHLFGGTGVDYINGGPGKDAVEGGSGNDIIQGDGFGDRVQNGLLGSPAGEDLNEASGLVVSRENTSPQVLWTIEDHANPSPINLYANNTDGTSRGYYRLKNVSNGVSATNVDWEDMAFYQDGGTKYLYIADIGDNKNERSKITIYRVVEPQISGTPAGTDLAFQVIDLAYPNDGFGGMNGGRNAETFMIDPLTGTFYIVTKFEPGRTKAHLYHVDKPAATDWKDDPANAVTKTLVDDGATRFAANTKTDSPSSGEISADGKEVVLKSDNVIELYRYDGVNNSNAISIAKLLTQNEPIQLVNARDLENREAVAFSADGSTLFTVSEKKKDGTARQIDSYARVTDLAAANLDSLVGGNATSGGGDSAGIDWTIAEPGEVVDRTGSEKDLILGSTGDMDFDGDVDFDDISPFTTGLQDPPQYFVDWRIGSYVHGDTDGDGDIDFDDIAGFNELLGI